MFDLKGKKALITGATGGIGSAVARALARQGATVGLSGRRKDTLKTLAAEIGNGAVAAPADLARAGEAGRLAKEVADKLGGLDIVVNNAGLTRDNLVLRMRDEEWEEVLKVNLEAAFRLSRAALRGMMKARWGRIVSITSIVGVTGNPGQANYAASKAGLIGFTKSLAQEVAGRGITVNCVAPGFIETAMTEGLTDQQKQSLLARIPQGRMGTADDVAAAVVFLSSEEAAYVTGQTLHVNGGMAMI